MTFRFAKALFFYLISLSVALAAVTEHDGVMSYLNSIRSFQAEFKQYDTDGKVRSGKLYILKPGKIRWEYLLPNTILIIGKGDNIVYYDQELEEVTYTSSKSSLAHFLTKPDIDFSKEMAVEQYLKGKDYSELTISDKKSSQETNISKIGLKFKNTPPQLVQLDVTDLNGNTSEILFSAIKINKQIDSQMFVFKNPKFFNKNRG